MIAHPATRDTTLERIITAIVEGVHPRRIILYGSRARGDARPDSDYDLLVEVDSPPDYYERRGKVLLAARLPGVPVDVLVRLPGELEARSDDPGFMDWVVWREGIVVYPADAPPLGTPAPRRVRESAEPPGSVREWLERAAEDLLSVENNLAGEHVPWSAVSFHSQQAAEKHVKALLIQRRIRPPRAHDLAKLLAAARQAGYDLPDFAAECALLADQAVDVRYPEGMPIPDEPTARAVHAAAMRIIEAARPQLRAG